MVSVYAQNQRFQNLMTEASIQKKMLISNTLFRTKTAVRRRRTMK